MLRVRKVYQQILIGITVRNIFFIISTWLIAEPNADKNMSRG